MFCSLKTNRALVSQLQLEVENLKTELASTKTAWPAGEQRPGTNGGNAGSQGVDGIATIITGKKLQITMIVYFTKML